MQKMIDGKGKSQQVQRGLVDKEGAFFFLLDTNDTAYYRFSNESELLTSLIAQRDKLMKSNDKYKKRVERLNKDVNALTKDIEELTKENIALKEKHECAG